MNITRLYHSATVGYTLANVFYYISYKEGGGAS